MDTSTERSIRQGGPFAFPIHLHRSRSMRSMVLSFLSAVCDVVYHCLPNRRPGFGTVLIPASLMAILLCSFAQAANVSLAWNPNTPAPDGYRVYQRLEGENYDYSSPAWPRNGDDPSQTTAAIENLADDTTYYFIVRAFVGSEESGDSNEVRHLTGSASANVSPDIETYTVTATAGANGSIVPGTTAVKAGDSKTFTIVPTDNHHVADVLVDGQSIGARTSYTFEGVDQDHTISARYAPDSLPGPDTSEDPPATGGNGLVPQENEINNTDNNPGFTMGPTNGNSDASVVADGQYDGAGTAETFNDVDRDDTITNEPPVADAGPDQTVDEAALVTLNGYNSLDNDDGIFESRWLQISGPAVELSATDDDIVTFTAPDVDREGVALEFEFIVTDASGATAKDRCLVNVTWVNEVPTADAGEDQTVKPGESIWLSGEASTDPEDVIESHEWIQLKGTPVELDDKFSPSPSFVAPDGGSQGASLVFQLTVTDMGGLQDTDTCTVNVASQNRAPVADAGPDKRVVSGSEVRLDSSGSMDPDGGTLTIQWRQTDGYPVALSDAQETSPVFTVPEISDIMGPAATNPTSGGLLVFELTATDDGGLSSVDACEIEVVPANKSEDEDPPEVKILYPSKRFIMTRRSKITISGTASDNYQIERVIWTDARGNSGEAMGTDRWRIEELPLKPWKNTITITAFDRAGNEKSRTLTIYAFYRYQSSSR